MSTLRYIVHRSRFQDVPRLEDCLVMKMARCLLYSTVLYCSDGHSGTDKDAPCGLRDISISALSYSVSGLSASRVQELKTEDDMQYCTEITEELDA